MGKNLGIGSKAPAFSLKDQNGEAVTLNLILSTGPAVLIFYPGDQTPGCTIQLCAIRDDWSDFEKAGIRVFGINPSDAESHSAFAKKHDFPFPLLVDEGRKVARAYGAEQDLLIAKVVRRTVVGIGQDGKILYYRQGLPRTNEILKAFKN
ncbi:peroxiredoxin [Candidatus Uhrbacteria bacterium]|nr:peroxiredoxin [Candidatus Uhrbacteria bacterium]